MSEEREHTLLSPSRLPRVMRCLGSVALEEQFPNDTSIFAAEGTMAHHVGAECIATGKDAVDYIGQKFKFDGFDFEFDEDHAIDVQKYIDLIRGYVEDGAILYKLEQRVDYSNWIGVEGQSGSADAILYHPELRRLIVPDLKFGMGVQVYAEGNEQGRGYALGTLNELDGLFDIDEVEVVIAQVRLENGITSEVLTVEELKAWAENELKPRGQYAYHLYEEFQAGAINVQYLDEKGHLVPGAKQCKFCRAARRGACPANEREALAPPSEAVTAADFEDLTQAPSLPKALSARMRRVVELSDEELVQRFLATDLIENWVKNVRGELERRLLQGHKIIDPAGGEFKLVRGRKGNRKIEDAEAFAEAAAAKTNRSPDDFFERKLKSVPVIEKLVGKTKPAWRELSDSFITQSEGKLSVARASDSRPADTDAVSASDFEVLPSAEDVSDLA